MTTGSLFIRLLMISWGKMRSILTFLTDSELSKCKKLKLAHLIESKVLTDRVIARIEKATRCELNKKYSAQLIEYLLSHRSR